jgi:hypothetical protein
LAQGLQKPADEQRGSCSVFIRRGGRNRANIFINRRDGCLRRELASLDGEILKCATLRFASTPFGRRVYRRPNWVWASVSK